MKHTIITVPVLFLCAALFAAEPEGELISSRIANSGVILIEGRYIKPPYNLEAYFNGLFVNGILLQEYKKAIDRQSEKKHEKINEAIKRQLYCFYYEEAENFGWEKAEEKLIDYLQRKQTIQNININEIRVSELHGGRGNFIEIVSDDYVYELPVGGGSVYKYLDYTIQWKAELVRNAGRKGGNACNELYGDLIDFLETQIKKDRVVKYKKHMHYITVVPKAGGYKDYWLNYEESKENAPTEAEAENLDRNNLKEFTVEICGLLDEGQILIASDNRLACCPSPGGVEILKEIRRIIADDSIKETEKNMLIRRLCFVTSISTHDEELLAKQMIDKLQNE